uniref:prestin-like isoform X2 n=1 Tax=Myxine glutinosa TaxID=7769 RepID=UPI00358F0527
MEGGNVVAPSLLRPATEFPYHVERPLITQAVLEEECPRLAPNRLSLRTCAANSLRCSPARAHSFLFTLLPVLKWLPKYQIRECLLGDVISGFSTAVLNIPQGMAYALLAGLPPIFGLYSSFYPPLVYFIFGTSRHVSLGTMAVVSVMVGVVVEHKVPGGEIPFQLNDSTNATFDDDYARVPAAAALACMSGLIQLVFGLLRFGFLVAYLSEPLVRAYTTAAAMVVVVSQLKFVFGVNMPRFSGPLAIVYLLEALLDRLDDSNMYTILIFVVCVLVLIGGKVLEEHFCQCLPTPIPWELLVVILATTISSFLQIKETKNVKVVGEIPNGLRSPVVPSTSLMGSLLVDAIAIAIVSFSLTASIGKMFALKYGDQIDGNQELLAIGLSNTVGSFFETFPISCSMSRSMLQDNTGGKTQVASLVSAIIVMVVIICIGDLFENLPRTVLAAIVLVNLKGMFIQFRDVPRLWRVNRVDLAVWTVTFIATLLLGLDMGLAVAVVFALLTILLRTQLTKYSLLGQISDTNLYQDVEEYPEAQEIHGVKIFQTNSSLYFANSDNFLKALVHKTGVDARKLITCSKRAEAKRKRKEARRAGSSPGMNVLQNGLNTNHSEEGNVTEIGHVPIPLDVPAEETYELSAAAVEDLDDSQRAQLIQAIVLDLSSVGFIDTVGVSLLQGIFQEYNEVGVLVCVAACRSSVLLSLEQAGFFESVSKSLLFLSIHDAVLYVQNVFQDTTLDNITSNTSVAVRL